MAKVKIQGHASGTGILTVTAPNTNTDRTITLPDGDVTLGAATPSIDDNGDATAITIDSSERVGIGTASPTEKLQVHGAIRSTNNATTTLADSGNFYYIPTADDASNPRTVISAVGTSSVGGHVTFKTGTSSSNTEKLRIQSGGGISFNGDTAAANALDDYEEGTHTPTITMGSGTATFYSSNNTLAYTKIGRVVHISGQVRIENTNSASGSFQISMPFTVLSGNAGLSAGNYRTYNVDTPDAGVQAVIYSEGGQAKATLEWSRDSIGSTEERATANGYYLIGLTYFV